MAKGVGARQCIHLSDGEDEAISELSDHSEPVKVMIVLCHMGTRVKIEHSAEGKVLDSLEFGQVC